MMGQQGSLGRTHSYLSRTDVQVKHHVLPALHDRRTLRPFGVCRSERPLACTSPAITGLSTTLLSRPKRLPGYVSLVMYSPLSVTAYASQGVVAIASGAGRSLVAAITGSALSCEPTVGRSTFSHIFMCDSKGSQGVARWLVRGLTS